MGFLTKEICLEFSTSAIKVVKAGKLISTEKAMVAIDDSGNIIATGNQVDEDTHKLIIQPVIGGIICDFNAFEQMLRSIINRALKKKNGSFLTPLLSACCVIPDTSTEVEIRAVRDALEHAGARKVFMAYSTHVLLEGLESLQKDTFLLVDAGAYGVRYSVYSNGSVLIADKTDIGGEKIKQLINSYLYDSYQFRCSRYVTEDILTKISLSNENHDEVFNVDGEDEYGISKSVEVSFKGIIEYIEPYLYVILNDVRLFVKNHLSESSNHLGYILLTGGFSKIKGLSKEIEEASGLPVQLYNDSDYILEGLKKISFDFETYKKAIR